MLFEEIRFQFFCFSLVQACRKAGRPNAAGVAERMEMLENKVPWWRRTLDFALAGIRSGFGLFSRPSKLGPVKEPMVTSSLEVNPEEETSLTDQSPQFEIDTTEPVSPLEPATGATPVPAASPASAGPDQPAAPLQELPTAPEPEQAAQAVPEPEPVCIAAPEILPEPQTSVSVEPGSAPEVQAANEVAAEPLETLPEAEPVLEPGAAVKDKGEPPVEAAPVPNPDATTAPEGASGSQPTPAAEPEPAPVTVPVPEAANPLVPPPESAADQKAEEKAAAKLAARQKKLDESSEQSPFSVFVGQVYDGPLDLLLDLIRKQDIDIYDIPIAKITAQFLAYVNQLKATDVDVAGEFIYTASLLIHIKSKMLLPRAASGPEDAAEDPRRELVERLLEHERFKSAAQMLQQKQMLEAATWSNPGSREFKGDAATEPEIAADTVDLVRIFREILERARKRPVLDVTEDSVTVGQMIQFLARRLTMEDKPVALRRLLSHTRSERALIAMFLALLELVRLQAILLRQDRAFSEIFIKKHTGFDNVMNDRLANAQDEWR
jgi:segregation and condensation protein A